MKSEQKKRGPSYYQGYRAFSSPRHAFGANPFVNEGQRRAFEDGYEAAAWDWIKRQKMGVEALDARLARRA